MVYLTLFIGSGNRATLSPVTEPKKNARGYYNVSKTTAMQKDQKIGYNQQIKTFGELDSFVVPVMDKTTIRTSKFSFDNMKYPISTNYDYSYVQGLSGKVELDKIKTLISLLDTDAKVRYMAITSSDEFGYREHKRGNWAVTRFETWEAYSSKDSKKKLVSCEHQITVTNKSKSSAIGKPKDSMTVDAFEKMVKKHFNYNTGKVESTDYFYSNNQSLETSFIKWSRKKTYYKAVLSDTLTILLPAGVWELGSVWGSNNVNDNYCFYSTDDKDRNLDKYVSYLGLANGTPKERGNPAKRHSCSTHGAQVQTSTTYYGTQESTSSKLTYDPYKNTFNGTKTDTSHAVGRLEFGTRGSYKDGVATVPYLILTLAGDKDFKSKIEMTIHEKDRNNFVSLTHERNLGDSYNTFQLQLFDKDAKQVEAKLLLGFRYIEFYYTDNVSTSKRFRGEVLDYKTVIVGKGLMLTLTGYTSNVQVYTGKESIPWSKIVEARSFSFYYWMNRAGEYHGEVRLTVADKYVDYGDDPKSPQEEVNILTSTEGMLLSPELVKESGAVEINKDSMYCFQASFQTGESKKDTEVLWTNFKRMYYDNLNAEKYIDYRPLADNIWSLNDYLKGRGTTIESELAGLDLSVGDLTEPRPSNIVILICVINGWAFRYKDIKKTRKVSSIPDMVSMSFTEYIKEELIPLSIAEGAGGSSQFYFWFDDDGFAHYGPQVETSSCSLYFNSKEVADSYPLVAFTAASNGSVLMQVDATNSMPSMNIYTGDEQDVSAVQLEEGDAYLENYHKTEEWYATNSLTQSSSKSRLITYSNATVSTSDEDLLKQLRYRYGYVSQYSFKASLDVYGCSDITPGQMVDIYIYIGDGVRSSDPVSKVNANSKQTGVDEYIGNTSIHHSSGRYFVNKITDTISGGRYLSTLEVLKINEGNLKLMIGNVESLESYEVKPKASDEKEDKETQAAIEERNAIEGSLQSYSQYKNLMGGR